MRSPGLVRAVADAFAAEYGGVPAEAVRTDIGRASAHDGSDPERHRRGRLALHDTRAGNVAQALAGLGVPDDGLARRMALDFHERRTAAICRAGASRAPARHSRGLCRELLRWRDLVAQLYLAPEANAAAHRQALRALLQLVPATAAQIPHLCSARPGPPAGRMAPR